MKVAFKDADLENKFFRFINDRRKYEVGGVLFYQFSNIANLHWKRHLKLFDCKYLAIVQDWLICPNVSNLPDRVYSVSDIDQFVGIAEQTADSRGLAFMHFHTHPNGGQRPSDNDLIHWLNHWQLYHSGSGQSRAAIVTVNGFDELHVACHDVKKKADKIEFSTGNFLRWQYINYKIRKNERERVKKPILSRLS